MCSYEHTIVITNRALVKGDFLEQLERVLRLRPHGLILREKDLSDAAYTALAKEVLALCRKEEVLCFLHSRIPSAKELNCRNLHLSVPALDAMMPEERRQLREEFDRISVSCHSMEDMRFAVECGASQIVLGTIFETDCKKGLKGSGTGFVREICRACPVPVYAIGGITPERLPEVMEAGAAGGCMMSGFMKL
ncbi:MAG: thiamine phosphate synthase [Lachnospiraceae bacterium]